MYDQNCGSCKYSGDKLYTKNKEETFHQFPWVKKEKMAKINCLLSSYILYPCQNNFWQQQRMKIKNCASDHFLLCVFPKELDLAKMNDVIFELSRNTTATMNQLGLVYSCSSASFLLIFSLPGCVFLGTGNIYFSLEMFPS